MIKQRSFTISQPLVLVLLAAGCTHVGGIVSVFGSGWESYLLAYWFYWCADLLATFFMGSVTPCACLYLSFEL